MNGQQLALGWVEHTKNAATCQRKSAARCRNISFTAFVHPMDEEEWGVTEQQEERKYFLGNIFFLQFDKRVQRGKNTLHVHNVGIALDAVAPVIFAKIPSKKFIDMAG